MWRASVKAVVVRLLSVRVLLVVAMAEVVTIRGVSVVRVSASAARTGAAADAILTLLPVSSSYRSSYTVGTEGLYGG